MGLSIRKLTKGAFLLRSAHDSIEFLLWNALMPYNAAYYTNDLPLVKP
jgi:hypothetical protein